MLDSKVVKKILQTFTERFTCAVVLIKETKGTKIVSIDELQSSLVVHEKKLKVVKMLNKHIR